MSIFAKLKHWYLIIILGVIGVMYYNVNQRLDYFEERLDLAAGTTSLQMYESIEHWSDSFQVPKHIAYNVAYLETRYQGPFDFDYEHRKTSSAGAVGPMQIITRWAHKYAGRRVTEKELRTNIDLNVMVSMKMLRARYNSTGDWAKACGGYNTGRPIINDYAQFAVSNKDYKSKWERL